MNAVQMTVPATKNGMMAVNRQEAEINLNLKKSNSVFPPDGFDEFMRFKPLYQ